uniref:galactose-1-epimerase n=1 Tax=Fulvivirga sp. TaxID=1931237 RepID=UPI004048FDF2
MKNGLFFILLACATLSSCSNKTESEDKSAEVDNTPLEEQAVFGTYQGNQVLEYKLTNKNGVEVKVINYGGIITSILTPNKEGVLEDIVLGYDTLSGYLKDSPYFGALIGRFGNRIANGRFELDGEVYVLEQNNNGQHLHGGLVGFDKVFWNIKELSSEDGSALELTYSSKDGEEGYPGELDVKVIYTLTDDNELMVEYEAETSKMTVVNLTQHTYFNLTGNVKGDILGHHLKLEAEGFLPVDENLIPTGEIQSVKGSPFDFLNEEVIGKRINNDDQQLTYGMGYDHCWVLNPADSLKLAATLYEPSSGRLMEVFTTEPGIQFYSGNFLDGSLIGKDNVKYAHRTGLCLETQHFPDSPNQPQFPSVVLNPDEVYRSKSVYKFSVR